MPVANGEANSEKNESSCYYHEVITCQAQTTLSEISQGTLSLDSQHVRSENLSTVITRARSGEKASSLIKHHTGDCADKEENYLSTEYGVSSRIPPWRRLNVCNQHSKRIMSYCGRGMSNDPASPDEILSNHLHANVKLGYVCPPAEQSDDETKDVGAKFNNVVDDLNTNKGTDTTLDAACSHLSTNDIACPPAEQSSDETKDGEEQSSVETKDVSDNEGATFSNVVADLNAKTGMNTALDTACSHPLTNNSYEKVTACPPAEQTKREAKDVSEDGDVSLNNVVDDLKTKTGTNYALDAACSHLLTNSGNGTVTIMTEMEDQVDEESNCQGIRVCNKDFECKNWQFESVPLEATTNGTNEMDNVGTEKDCVSKIVEKMVQSVCDSPIALNVDEKCNDFDNGEISASAERPNESGDTTDSHSASSPSSNIHCQNVLFKATTNGTNEMDNVGTEKDCVSKIVEKMVQTVCDSPIGINVDRKCNDFDNGEICASAERPNESSDTTVSLSASSPSGNIHCQNVPFEATTNGTSEMDNVGTEEDCVRKIVENMAQSVSDSPFASNIDRKCNDLDNGEVSALAKRHNASDDTTDSDSPSGTIHCQPECSVYESLDCADRMDRISDEMHGDNNNKHSIDLETEFLIGEVARYNSCSADYCNDHPQCEDCERNRVTALMDFEDNDHVDINNCPKSLQDSSLRFGKDDREKETVSSISFEGDETNAFQCVDYQNLGDESHTQGHEIHAAKTPLSTENGSLDAYQSFESKQPDLNESIQTDFSVVEMIPVEERLHGGINRSSDSEQQDHGLIVWQDNHKEEGVCLLSAEESWRGDNDRSLYLKQHLGGNFQKDETLLEKELCMPSISTDKNQDVDICPSQECKRQDPGLPVENDDVVSETVTDVLSISTEVNEHEMIPHLRIESEQHDVDANFQSDHSKLQNFTSKTSFCTVRSSETQPTQIYSTSNVVSPQILPTKMIFSDPHMQKLNKTTQHAQCHNSDDIAKPAFSHSLVPTIRLSRPVDQEPKNELPQVQGRGTKEIVKHPRNSVSGKVRRGTKFLVRSFQPGKATVLFVQSTGNITPMRGTFVASVAVSPNLCPSSPSRAKRATVTEHDNYSSTSDIPDVLPTPFVKDDAINVASSYGKADLTLQSSDDDIGNCNTRRTPSDVMTSDELDNNTNVVISESTSQGSDDSGNTVVYHNQFDKHSIDEENSFAKELFELDDLDCSKCTKCVSCNHGSSATVYNVKKDITGKVSQLRVPKKEADQINLEIHEEFSELSLPTTLLKQNHDLGQGDVCNKAIEIKRSEVECHGHEENVVVTCYIDDPLTSDASGLESLDTSLCIEDVLNSVKSPCSLNDSKIHAEHNDIKVGTSTHLEEDCRGDNGLVEVGENLICEKTFGQACDVLSAVDEKENRGSCVEITAESSVETSQGCSDDLSLELTDHNPVTPNPSINEDLIEPANPLHNEGTDLNDPHSTVVPMEVSSNEVLEVELEGTDLNDPHSTVVPMEVSSNEVLEVELHSPVECRDGLGKDNDRDDTDPAHVISHFNQDHHWDCGKESCHDIGNESDEANLNGTVENPCALTNANYIDDIFHCSSQVETSGLPAESTVTMNDPTDIVETINVVECANRENEKADVEKTDVTQVHKLDLKRECVRHEDMPLEKCDDESKDNTVNDTVPGLESDSISHIDDNEALTDTGVSICPSRIAHVEESPSCETVDVYHLPGADEGLRITEIPENFDNRNFTCGNDLDAYHFQSGDMAACESDDISSNDNKLVQGVSKLSSEVSDEYNMMQQQGSSNESTAELRQFSKAVDFRSVEDLATSHNRSDDNEKTNEFDGIDANLLITDEINDNSNSDGMKNDVFDHNDSSEDVDTVECSTNLLNSEPRMPVVISSCEHQIHPLSIVSAEEILAPNHACAEVSVRIGFSGDIDHRNMSVFCHAVGCDCKPCQNQKTQSNPHVDLEKRAISLDGISYGVNGCADKDNLGKELTSSTHLSILHDTPRDEKAVSPKIIRPTAEEAIQHSTHSVQKGRKDDLFKNVLESMRPTLQLEDIRSNREIWTSDESLSFNLKSRNCDFDDEALDDSGLNTMFQSLPITMVEEARACVKPMLKTMFGHETCASVERTNTPTTPKPANQKKRKMSGQGKTANSNDLGGVKSGEKATKPKQKRTSSLCSVGKDGEKPITKKKGLLKKKYEVAMRFIAHNPCKDLMENVCPNISASSLLQPQPSCTLSTKSAKSSYTNTYSSVGGCRSLNCNTSSPGQNLSTPLTKTYPSHDSTTLDTCNTVGHGHVIPEPTVDVSNSYRSQSVISLANLSAKSSATNDMNVTYKFVRKIPSHLEPILKPPPPKYLDHDVKLQKRTRVSIMPMEHDGTLPPISADCRFDLKRLENMRNNTSRFGVGLDPTYSPDEELSSLHANVNTGSESHVIPEIHEVTTVMRSSPILCSKPKAAAFYSNAMMGTKNSYFFDRPHNLFEPFLSMSTCQLHSSTQTYSSSHPVFPYNNPNDVVNKQNFVASQAMSSKPSVTDLMFTRMHRLMSERVAADKSMPSTSSLFEESWTMDRPGIEGYFSQDYYKQTKANPRLNGSVGLHSAMRPQSYFHSIAENSRGYDQHLTEQSSSPLVLNSLSEQTSIGLSPNLKHSNTTSFESDTPKQSLPGEYMEKIYSEKLVPCDWSEENGSSGSHMSSEVRLHSNNPLVSDDLERLIHAELSTLHPDEQMEDSSAIPSLPAQSIRGVNSHHNVTISKPVRSSISTQSTEQSLTDNVKKPVTIVDQRKPSKKKIKANKCPSKSLKKKARPRKQNIVVDYSVSVPSMSMKMLHNISCKDTGVKYQQKEEHRIKFISRKPDHSELPFSVLTDRDKREILKHTEDSFVQDAPCFDIARMYGVETSGPTLGDHSWRKCRECRSAHRRDSAAVFCRFYGFRKLRFRDSLLCTAGFLLPEDCSPKDLQLWLPQQSCFHQLHHDDKNVLSPADPFDPRVADFILANIGKRFCEIVRIEEKAKSWLTEGEQLYWKRPVPGVRDLCDVCETTLFNIHWICHKCGYGVCLDCFERRMSKSSREQATYDSKPTNSFRWARCVQGKSHIHLNMVPTQIIPSTCLTDLNEKMHDICKTRKIQTSCRCQKLAKEKLPRKSKVCSTEANPSIEQQRSGDVVEKPPDSVRKRRASDGAITSRSQKRPKLEKRPSSVHDKVTSLELSGSLQPSIRIPLLDFFGDLDAPKADNEKSTKCCEDQRSNQQSSEAQLQWLCGGRLLQLTDSQHPGNLEIFKTHWKRGIPVVVSGVGKYLDMNLWHPMRLSNEYGEEESKNSLINCLNGSIVTNMKIRDFWDGFENISSRLCDEDNKTMILKLKDWPPTEAFHDVMPEMFEDLMGALPLPEYTFIGGRCNLASRLPQFFVKPDLGPKMYNAYGWVTETNWKQGTTNLHLDISDAVNVMVYVGIPHDEPEDAKERLLQIVDEGDVDEIQRMRAINEKPGALWHIFHEKDVDEIRKFIKSVWMERGEVDAADHDPIHDQQMYLDRGLRRRLKEEYGVEGCGIVQCEGDGVFIPAGAPHQVFNLHSCIKIAEDFVSPEHVDKCFYLTNEFRYLSSTHSNHEDKLQIKNIIYHAVKDITSSAMHSHCLPR